MQKILKPTAVPHIVKWSDLPSPASAERIRRDLKRKISANTEADSVAWVSWIPQHRLLPSRQEKKSSSVRWIHCLSQYSSSGMTVMAFTSTVNHFNAACSFLQH
ncbi:hypothetical protein LSH36_354g02032 [Paralvinella palmiformis]|uniref:Uncharacterized protein n=1 Tax=Paralvinella palmiformis TaxID=53620 RepID=A0AAD9MZM4_9ANNE|nr:hypothetical protein LSH36_354g02032 [Paralvinella palmiformis]